MLPSRPNSGSSNRRFAKKNGFLIDKITEDTFYDNLLLGLIPLLKSCSFVSDQKLEFFPPATHDQIASWESANLVRLPEDLRSFYLSTNGFSFSYKFQYDAEESYCVIGRMCVNSLHKLQVLTTGETCYIAENGSKVIIPQTRVFVLADLEDNSFVVLANFNVLKPLSVYLYYKMTNFFFLCKDITIYLRMSLAYLGVPGWQLAVLNATLPEWSLELFRILAPGVLHTRQIAEQSVSNVIDEQIFEEDYYYKKKKKTPRKK